MLALQPLLYKQVCVPEMVNIVLINNKPKSESFLCAGLISEALVSGKSRSYGGVVRGAPCCLQVAGPSTRFSG